MLGQVEAATIRGLGVTNAPTFIAEQAVRERKLGILRPKLLAETG
jgi:hypothetical protein